MKKTALILGASGLTGSLVLEALIQDDRYDKIKLFSRSTINPTSSKVEEYLGDLLNLDAFSEVFTGDEVYCCIGTTKNKTPNKAMYRNIDFGIPTRAARLAKDNNIETFSVVSALGANEKSLVFYNKTKGEMEQAVLKEEITNTYILRPSMIGGNREEHRTGEQFLIKAFHFLNPLLIGGLKKYRLIEAETIAKAMIQLSNEKPNKNIIESDEIQKITLK
jgi:uncharacterized protein YbjT (DUF2867 family)